MIKYPENKINTQLYYIFDKMFILCPNISWKILYNFMCLLTDVVFFRDCNLVDCLTVTKEALIYLQPIYGAESLAEVTVTVAPIIISLVRNTLTYC